MAINKEYETTVNLIGDSQGITISSATVSHVQVAAVSFLAGPKGNQGDPATNLVTSVNDKQGSVIITKTDTGLGNVDNTSDLDKPVSTATQSALNSKVDRSSAANVLYGRNTANVEAAIPMTETAATPWTVPRRDSAGRIKVVAAAAVEDAVNKAQMDAADALKVNKAGDTMTGTLTVPSAVITDQTNGIRTAFNTELLRMSGGTASDGGVIILGGSTNPALANRGVLRVGATTQVEWNSIRTEFMSRPVRINGVDYLTGTGFPNGVASAPVGSIYIDTNITNGASSWIKKSGTGNTGWQVLEGDTGWRNVTSLINTTDFSSTGLMVRRNGNAVSWANTVTALTAGSANSVFLPATIVASLIGFTASETYPGRKTFLNGAWPGTSVTQGRKGPGRTSAGWPITTTIGAVIDLQSDYMCTDAWPTTLPGTAV